MPYRFFGQRGAHGGPSPDYTRGMSRHVIAIAAMLTMSGLLPSTALAQRGGAFVAQEPSEGPRSQFPGAFNTHMADRGTVVVDAPFFQIDYGVTDNLTVGINPLLLLPVAAGELPGGIGKLRYRLYDDGTLSSAVTLLGGVGHLPGEGADASERLALVYGSATLGYRLSPRQRIGGTVFGGRLALRSEGGFTRNHLQAVALAADYEAFFTARLGINLTLVGATSLAVGEESFSSIATASFHPSLGDRLVLRALALAQPSDRWFIGAGALAPMSLRIALPWLTIARSF